VKLRGYVAEFLHERSLERLRIFISPTCVGEMNILRRSIERS